MYYIILFDFFYYYFPNYKTARAFFKYNRRFRGDYLSGIFLCIDFDFLTAENKRKWTAFYGIGDRLGKSILGKAVWAMADRMCSDGI